MRGSNEQERVQSNEKKEDINFFPSRASLERRARLRRRGGGGPRAEGQEVTDFSKR